MTWGVFCLKAGPPQTEGVPFRFFFFAEPAQPNGHQLQREQTHIPGQFPLSRQKMSGFPSHFLLGSSISWRSFQCTPVKTGQPMIWGTNPVIFASGNKYRGLGRWVPFESRIFSGTICWFCLGLHKSLKQSLTQGSGLRRIIDLARFIEGSFLLGHCGFNLIGGGMAEPLCQQTGLIFLI